MQVGKFRNFEVTESWMPRNMPVEYGYTSLWVTMLYDNMWQCMPWHSYHSVYLRHIDQVIVGTCINDSSLELILISQIFYCAWCFIVAMCMYAHTDTQLDLLMLI